MAPGSGSKKRSSTKATSRRAGARGERLRCEPGRAGARGRGRGRARPLPPAANSQANYTVVARRYRPQRFEDVVGQDHVVQALRNAIRLNRLAQAYLFCGTRGVGKTSMARIFAKCLNCVNGPTESPCQVCDLARRSPRGRTST